MSRPLRIEYPGAYYHVMNRGRGRQRIYHRREDYEGFLNLLEETHRMWGIRVHAYCLLPNHYHLLIETPQANLSRALRHINGLYTQQYNRVHHTDGPLFRGRYKAILVDAEPYLLQVVRYIHRNPVEARMVTNPKRHRWSSHRYYLGEDHRPEGLVTEEVLGRFHQRRAQAIERYEAFILDGLDEETLRVYSRGNTRAVWGGLKFRERVRKQSARRKTDYEIPESKRSMERPSLQRIEQIIMKTYGISKEKLRSKQRGFWNEPRNLAIYLGRMVGGYRLVEIGRRWGDLQYSSVSRMVLGTGQRMQEDRNFFRRAKKIEDSLIKSQM